MLQPYLVPADIVFEDQPLRETMREYDQGQKKHRPHFDRLPLEEAPIVNLQSRDVDLLFDLWRFHGVLRDDQIQRLYFGSRTRAKDRLGLLFQGRYLNRFNRQQRNAYGYMAYFLDDRGIELVCSRLGKDEKALYIRRLGDQKLTIHHDLLLNDVLLSAFLQMRELPETELVEWMNARTFKKQPEKVTYKVDGKDVTKRMEWDSYFHIITPGKAGARELRYFLELDNDTNTNEDIAVEKFRPFMAYRNSPRFAERFGSGLVRYLIVTTTPLKVRNIRRKLEELAERTAQKEAAAAAIKICCLTTYDAVMQEQTFFTEPVWERPFFTSPVALFGRSAPQERS